MVSYRVTVDPIDENSRQRALIDVDYDRKIVSLSYLIKKGDMTFWVVIPSADADPALAIVADELREVLELTLGKYD